MYKKYLNLYNVLIIGILTLTLGILTLTLSKKFLFVIIYLVSITLMLYALSGIIKLASKKIDKKKNGIILQIFSNMIIAITFVSIPNIPLSIFSLIFGIYILFNAFVKIINYILFKINKVRGRIIELIVFVFYLVFGLSCILFPIVRIDTILTVIGIYFIMLGSTYILDFINQVMPTKQKNKIKKKFKIKLPVFLSVLIPYNVLMQVNKNKDISKKKSDISPDLEIFIHVTKEGYGTMGHADFYFDNEVISFGNYDSKSIKLFEAIGDGVLFRTPHKDEYLKFCITDSKKTIFGFGISLTEKQKEIIREQIKKIMNNTYEWNYPSICAKEEAVKKEPYAIRLYRNVGANFYKFKNSKFKTFFVLNTNCVMLVDYILGKAGLDILKVNGIITPGTYYDFLATEYMKKNSNVISYTIYK